MNYSKVRKWQVQFEVHRPLTTLPVPDIVVEEVQEHYGYRHDGRNRGDFGGQLSITIGGRGGVRVAGVDHVLTPGRAFLHYHCDPEVCYYYPQDGKEPWNFLWMAFDGLAAVPMITEINSRYGYLFDVPLNSPLVARLMGFRVFRSEIRVLTPVEAGQLAVEVFGELCSLVENELRESPRGTLIRDVQSVIASELGGGVTVESLSERFDISREHLSRIFREQTGGTLHSYITRVRLRLAVDLLLQTRLTGKEIAARCGCADYSVLYRMFRKRLGTTPEALRESGFRPEI